MNRLRGETMKLPTEKVSRRILQFAAALVVFFASLTPLANCFDSWDKGPPADDTELHLSALFVGVGFVLVLPKLLHRFLIPRIRIHKTAQPSILCVALLSFDQAASKPTISPRH